MPNIDLRNPTVQKGVLAVLLAAGVLAIFFATHFLPFGYPNQQEKLNALKGEYERKSTELARARTTVADLPRFEAEYAQLHDRWTLAGELLPTDRELGSLLRRITLAGEETGVQFVLFKPAPPRTENYFTEMPVQIAVNGGYHQVGSFLAELANMRRIVTVSNVRLKAASASGGNSLTTTSADFTASAYSLNSTPTGAAATKGRGHEGGSNARKSS
jgi:type IV pilus assembly protein PilO